MRALVVHLRPSPGYFSWRSLSDAVKLARNDSIALVALVVLVIGGALLHRRLRGD